MSHRLQREQPLGPKLRLGTALLETFREGYDKAALRADIMAGLVVGVVALPLSMALAIASGVPPQHGLYTAIVAGAVIAALGGSRVQVSGPTAAFVVILAPISSQFGVGGLAVASLMAGLILIGMGAARLGKLLQFVPHPVTTGFTAGIAVVIGTLQLKDFFGLEVEHLPDHYLPRVAALWHAAPTFALGDLAVGALTLLLLVYWPRFTKRVPAPLVALTMGALVGLLIGQLWPQLAVETINTRFVDAATGRAGIPQLPPLPTLPWSLGGANGAPLPLSLSLLRELANASIAIAMLGAIESLLSATVADGMTGQKHEPNAELVAQGIGNVLAPFFGGFAATGAIARTATNIRSGARSPVAAMVHAAFVLAAVLLLAPLLGYLPMASMAALLLLVAWNMGEAKHFLNTLRSATRSDVLVLLTCFLLTVVFDMVVSVTVGVMLAALLFMARMADVANVRSVDEGHHAHEKLPKGVLHYEIAGPLFFGAAERAMSALHAIGGEARVVLIDVRSVPVVDATGLVGLQSTIARLHKRGIRVIVAGLQPQPSRALAKAGIEGQPGLLALCQSFDEGVRLARADVSPQA